jgi:4-aminobutyrate aminotransferase-like enzyme
MPSFGSQLPNITTSPPGELSTSLIDSLARTECPAITARRARRERETGVDQDPIVWERARGANVEDVDGNVYVDMTSGFAVAGLGHNPQAVREAAHEQVDSLNHAMGDVYPARTKIEFCDLLAEVTPGDLQQSILGLSGSDAVQAALKTAAVYSGEPGAIAFWGGYHGMAYGALSATAYRKAFRRPFLGQLNRHIQHAPYPDPFRPPFGRDAGTDPDRVLADCMAHLEQLVDGPATGGEGIGAVIVEPIQGRGGEVVPPEGFLRRLREFCDTRDLVLIFDEIYTGFGRTGELFAGQREGVVPDVMCVGKAMGGGFPLSAAIGRPEIMEAWDLNTGEAIHTQTFLGNPLGCAMASAAVREIVEAGWPDRVAERGAELGDRLADIAADFPERVGQTRGAGFMWGLDLVDDADPRAPDPELALALTDWLRDRGYLVLPSGTHGNVLAVTPPFVATDAQLDAFLDCLHDGLDALTGATPSSA